jgi:hypothetical protein
VNGFLVSAQPGFGEPFRSDHRDQVKAENRAGEPRIALDLKEVDLVDVEGVGFLNACEAEGISVVRCSPYIGEWMLSGNEGGQKARTMRHTKRQTPWEIENEKHVYGSRSVSTGCSPCCRPGDFEAGGRSGAPPRGNLWRLSFRLSNGTGRLSGPEIAASARA